MVESSGFRVERAALKIIIFLLLAVLLTSSLTGCWDWRETSSFAIILGAGVDWVDNNRIRLTIQIAKPSSFVGGQQSPGTQTQSASWVIWAEGDTIQDAEKNLLLLVPRDIYWGHCIIMILGDKMAGQGTHLVTNYLQRKTTPRETMWLTVAKGDAKDFLEAHSEIEKTFSQHMNFLIRMQTAYPVNLKDFTQMLASKGMQPVLPLLELKEVGVAPKTGIEEKIPIIHTTYTISGLAAFKQDKLIGLLNLDESEGLRYLKGVYKRSEITIPSPTEPDKKVSLQFLRVNTKITPLYDGKNIQFNVEIKTKGRLLEQQSMEDLATPEKIKALKKQADEKIKQKAQAALNKAQKEYGVDIFGFGDAFHRKYKKEWKQLKDNWDENFTKAQVNIAVNAEISHTGLITDRLSKPRQ